MSEWNVTFTDGTFVIMKDVPAGKTEADVRKEIAQQPKYKGKEVARAVNTENASTAPGPITANPPAEKPPTKVKPAVKPPETVKPQVKPSAEKPTSTYKPPVINPNVDPGSAESIRQPDGSYRVDISGTSADPIKPPSNGNGQTGPSDDVINNAVKKKEEAEKAKKAAAEAEKKARETKDADDKKDLLKKQEEYRIAQEKADQAKKDAKERQDTIDAFEKDGKEKADREAREKLEKNKPAPADNKPAPADNKPVTPAPADNKPTPIPTEVKPEEPAGPSLWDRIKAGASEVGQAIGGALTPSNTPSTPAQPLGQTDNTVPNPAPSKEQLKSEIEKKLDELDKSPDPAVRQRAQAARARLNGQPSGPGSGAKVQDTGNKPGGGGKTDIDNTSKPGKDGTNPQGTQPGPGTGTQGTPGTGTAPGAAPGAAPGVAPGPSTKPVPAGDSDVDGDKIRKQRREQEAELKRLQQLPDKNANEPAGGWRDAGQGTRVWRGGPGTDPKWQGYVFTDGDIMPAGKYSTGVGNSRTSTYSGNAGTDQFDRQAVDKLLYDRERQAQEIERLKKQKGVNEDFDRILKLAGLNK